MSLNIRHWLASRQIELDRLAGQSAQVAGVAFRIVQDMEVKSLTPFDICALAEVLELPLGAAWLAIEPIKELSIWLLRLLSRKKPLKRNEGTWLTFQIAYLNALQGILEQESLLRRPWINRAIDFGLPPTFPGIAKERDIELGFEKGEFELGMGTAGSYGDAPVTLTGIDEPFSNPKSRISEAAQSAVSGRMNLPDNSFKVQNPRSRPRQVYSTLNDQQTIALLKTLRSRRLSDSQAEQALSLVGESFLVQQLNSTAIAWFIANGAEETEAKLIAQRLVHGLPGHLLAIIAENTLPLAQLQKFVRLANLVGLQGIAGLQQDTASIGSIDRNNFEFSVSNTEFVESSLQNAQNFPLNLHREHYRATLLQALSEPLLAETFALKDLYVPLKGLEQRGGEGERERNSQPPVSAKPVDLMEWAIAQMEDTTSIAVIEALPGYGKTSFCQMLASRVAQELYPGWMPIFIRLRDATLGETLEETVDSAFPLSRSGDRDGWFSLNSPPCLLILDGLNELPLSYHRYTPRHIEAFLDQLVEFQSRHVASIGSTPRHKILLTSEPSTIRQACSRPTQQSNPYPLRRIAIQPMAQEEFRLWFQYWAKLQSKSIAQGYFSFLKQTGVFRTAPALKELAILVHQPLTLYLLGVLHRDGQLDDSILHMDYSQLKFEIYDRICRWLLAYPEAGRAEGPHLVREGLAHACRSPEAIANLLQNRTPQQLRHQMQVAALTLVQSGQHQVPHSKFKLPTSLNFGLDDEKGENQEISRTLKSEDISLSLPAFFFRTSDSITQNPKSPTSNRIEFSHSNLGEYLCAEEIATQLKSLTQQVQHPYGEVAFVINSPNDVAQHIYSMLGYGVLSTEIEEFVVERLRRESARTLTGFSLSVLFERLYRFYRGYCQGRWLDEGIAHLAHAKLQARSNPQNVYRVDASVGLNVFLLLCAIARVAQVPFLPCGDPSVPREFDADQLLTLIGRTAALSPTAFWQRMCCAIDDLPSPQEGLRPSLSQVQLAGACLNHAMFAQANLWQANLSGAELIRINLSFSNLQEANLSWANLSGADLSGTNLSGANLEGANLSGADLLHCNLTLANLNNVCLFEAKLDENNRKIASLNGAIFSLEEFNRYIRSLKRTKSSGREPDYRFSATQSALGLIESIEGEPISPNYSSDEDAGEETVVIDLLAQGVQLSSSELESLYDDDATMLENPPSDQ